MVYLRVCYSTLESKQFPKEYLKVIGKAISDSRFTSECGIVLERANSAQRSTSKYFGEPSVTQGVAQSTLYYFVTRNKY